MTAQKADFDEIYTQPDPRAYYRTLGELDYEIPTHGSRVFEILLTDLRERSDQPTVLDLCCSYGVNAALLNHEVTLDELAARYREVGDVDRDELIEHDRSWFGDRRRDDAVDVIGLDASEPAIAYAVDSGLLAAGLASDLESEGLDDDDAELIGGADLITVTGGIGYIGGRTFERVLDAVDDPPWVAALSLRWVDFDPIEEALDACGLVTERVDGFVVPQRRFADDAEAAFVMEQLQVADVEPTAIESEGSHAAELYVARPAASVTGTPLDELLADLR